MPERPYRPWRHVLHGVLVRREGERTDATEILRVQDPVRLIRTREKDVDMRRMSVCVEQAVMARGQEYRQEGVGMQTACRRRRRRVASETMQGWWSANAFLSCFCCELNVVGSSAKNNCQALSA